MISIQKKNMETKVGFQLRNFCTYAECFAKEHEHWGENILKIKFRKKKTEMQCDIFPQKAQRLQARMPAC